MIKVFFLTFAILAFGAQSAEVRSFKLKNGTLSFAVPSQWQEAKKLFGVELMLLGPMQGKNRSVLTVESTEFSELSFDAASLKKNEASYQEGRKKWLNKYQGKVIEFFPYEIKKLMNGKIEDHVVGFRYKIAEKEFTERSHFIKCNKNLYHFKLLFPFQEETQYKTEIENLFQSFSCSTEEKTK